MEERSVGEEDFRGAAAAAIAAAAAATATMGATYDD